MKQQTAVEWLISQLRKPYGDKFINEIIEQAKELEKQEIIDAWESGVESEYQYHINLQDRCNVEEYYNETYGSKSNPKEKSVKPINLTSTQIIELAQIGKDYIYEGYPKGFVFSNGGVIRIIQKYLEMTSSENQVSNDEKSKNFTAVEWLEKELNEKGKLTPVDIYQAKEMEKQEYEKIYDHAFNYGVASTQKELSDEEINEEAKKFYKDSDIEYYAFFMGATVYRDKIKSRR